MSNFNYKKITPFKWFVLQNFPFIDEDFDAITNYQLFCKLGEEINKVIESVNLSGEQVENLTNEFNNLLDYVNNYFENLDVQDEINNKLDDLVEDGTIARILNQELLAEINEQVQEIDEKVDDNYETLSNRINQQTDSLNTAINNQNSNLNNAINFQNLTIENNNLEQNGRISELQIRVNQIASGSPKVVDNISDMTDQTQIYVLSTNGQWYYYDGTEFVSGGTYQSALDSDTVTNLEKIVKELSMDLAINKFEQKTNPTSEILPYNWVNNGTTSTILERNGWSQLQAGLPQLSKDKYYYQYAELTRNQEDTCTQGYIMIQPYINMSTSVPAFDYTTGRANIATTAPKGNKYRVGFGFKLSANNPINTKLVAQNLGSASKNFNFTITKFGLLEFDTQEELDNIIRLDSLLNNNNLVQFISQYGLVIPNDKYGNAVATHLNDRIDSIEVPTYDTDIIFWGDSLTAGAGGSGTSYPSVVGNLLNKEIMNMGIGGETSYTILARQGSITPVIPANADCSAFVLKDINGNNLDPLIQGTSGVNPIKIGNDNTEYTLSRNQDGTYKITNNNTVIQSSVVPRFIKFAGSELSGTITVIFAGQNGARGTTLLNQLKNAVRKCLNNKYVIVGLTSGTTASRQSLNDLMYAEFGNKFFDAGEYVSKYGMALMNMTPSAEDTQAINQGSIPPSLLSDNVHMNSSGYTAMGTFLANFIKALNY